MEPVVKPPRVPMAKRDPTETRKRLLEAAFNEIQKRGFAAASLESILSAARVTKGALYHHFPSKAALGYAVVDELTGQAIRAAWVRPLHDTHEPIGSLQDIIRRELLDRPVEELDRVAPAIKLAQEMSGQDEEFRKRLDSVMTMWRGGIAAALSRGQRERRVREEVDVHRLSAFVVAAVAGILATAKASRNADQLRGNVETLCTYLDGLRATPNRYSTATSQAFMTG
jgi:TetR/AcrR family transcriptional regulator, transcriptional repressor for nem operon